MKTPRYTVVHLNSYTGEVRRVIGRTNKRRTAHRMAARATFCSRVQHLVEVYDRAGRVVDASRSRWRREADAAHAQYVAHLATRVVWG